MKHNRQLLAKCVSFCAALFFSFAHAYGQLNQGSLSGHVVDSSGAAVSHAQISARDLGTGIAVTSESNDAGEFRFPALPLGTYDVSVSAAGFKTARYAKVIIQVNSVAVLEVSLQVGGTNVSVL